MNSTNKDFIYKFNDKFKEKNANNLTHMFESKGIIQAPMWECDLRNDGKKYKSEIKKGNSNKRGKEDK